MPILEALYRSAAFTDGKVDITDISWYMPQIKMTPEYLTGMRTLIEQKITFLLLSVQGHSEQTTLTQTRELFLALIP